LCESLNRDCELVFLLALGSLKSVRDNKAIIETRKVTQARRKVLKLSQYECKVQHNKLSSGQERELTLMFREAKWCYNAIVTSPDVFKFDTKIKSVGVHLKSGIIQVRAFKVLCAQMKQDLQNQAKSAIKTLSTLKKRGKKVGALRPVRALNSIPLRQYGVTYRVVGTNGLKVAGITGKLRVNGMSRIPPDVEWANARLVRRPTGLFVIFTVYENKTAPCPASILGCDLGVKTGLTFSNGIEVDTAIPVSENIKRACRKVSRTLLKSKRRLQARSRLQKVCHHHKERVKDTRNKILYITRGYAVAIQDDNVAGWQRLWGAKVQSNGVGAIKQGWKKNPSSIIIDRFVRTTRVCRECGLLLHLELTDRVINCLGCGHVEPRDVSSARAIGMIAAQTLPVERRLMPLETKPSTRMLQYLQGLPHIRARLVDEGKKALVTKPGSHAR
jgi:putative transposase